MDDPIDIAARSFSEAGCALADALLVKLEAEHPDAAKQAGIALQSGERMQILLEFSLQAPSIVWQVIDDYDRTRRLMSIPARMPTQQ